MPKPSRQSCTPLSIFHSINFLIMSSKEKTNEVPTTPAYIVSVVDLANPNRYTPRTFLDDLLSARQAAFGHVQRVLTQKLAHEVLQVTVELAEIKRSSVGGKHKVIATVFNQRFERTAFMKDGKDLLKDAKLDDFTKRSLPPSLFKVADLEQDKAFSSLGAVWASLDELENEAGYYQNNAYQTGFGFVQIEQLVEHNLIKKGLAQPAPSTYVVLYDAFTYAASIVSRFNDSCTDENNMLSFNTQFLSSEYHLEETH